MEVKKDGKRYSGLELLRIICIILIIFHHYANTCQYDQFTTSNLSWGKFFIQILSLFGRPACSVFAMITGYFYIDGKYNVKKFVLIVGEVYFYSIFAFLFTYLVLPISLNTKDIMKMLLPILYGNWYIVYYMLFFLLIPYINIFLKSLNAQTYSRFLVILLVIWSVVPTFTRGAWSFSAIEFFFVMYSIGGYIKLYGDREKLFKRSTILLYASTGIMMLSVFIFDFVGCVFEIDSLVSSATYFKEYNNVIAVIWSISIFEVFLNLKFYSKFINSIASCVLGIYLLHDNYLVTEYIWNIWMPNRDYVDFPYFHVLGKVVLVFGVCIIIEFIRQNIFIIISEKGKISQKKERENEVI